jgi:hypothetical protein
MSGFVVVCTGFTQTNYLEGFDKEGKIVAVRKKICGN